MKPRPSFRRLGWLIALIMTSLACASTTDVAPLVDPRLVASDARPVLVFVPGITGSKLRERDSGTVLWGAGRNLIRPRDGGYELARSIHPDTANRLDAFAVIGEMRLAGIRKPIYGPVRDLFVANGYRLGDIEAPTADATLYLVPYDWRQDNVASARQLLARLEAIRAARGDGALAVDLVCQSNGAHICRYVVKYGGASLDAVEAKTTAPPDGITFERVIFVGAANGGSIRILRELDRGRRYVPLAGRHLRPETLFTFPSLYQDLPAYRDDLFLDEAGRPMSVDLYDAESWRRYGWSVFRPAVAKRLARADRPDLFGTPRERMAFLTQVLARARRFQAALAQDAPGFVPPRYHQIQNRSKPTPERAVLIPRGAGWKALFVGDRGLRAAGLIAAASSEGDGHAAVVSQRWLSPQERAALADTQPDSAFFVDGKHFEMILEPATHRRLLEILRPEAPHPTTADDPGPPAIRGNMKRL